MNEQKISLKFCFKLGKTSKETYATLVRVYEDQALSTKCVYEWFARFREGRVKQKIPKHWLHPFQESRKNIGTHFFATAIEKNVQQTVAAAMTIVTTCNFTFRSHPPLSRKPRLSIYTGDVLATSSTVMLRTLKNGTVALGNHSLRGLTIPVAEDWRSPSVMKTLRKRLFYDENRKIFLATEKSSLNKEIRKKEVRKMKVQLHCRLSVRSLHLRHWVDHNTLIKLEVARTLEKSAHP
ncbi:hypothetical protein TNCV_4738691 [Trichonephila clavipes]|nr:hypothetical protein TNCV_4738691 [Trichonephila clavipes]